MHSPFSGVRILEISAGISGSYCGRMLADAGADVVKVEPESGDPLRRWVRTGVPLGPTEDGALFRFLSGGKRSVVLDSPGATDLSHRADAIIFDRADGWNSRTISQLAADHPEAVVVSISPFGLSGPYVDRDLPVTEFVLQALCGSTGSRGLKENSPLQAGGRIGEWVAGTFAAVALAAALRRQRLTGAGELIDVSTYECMISVMGGLGAVSHSVLGADSPMPGRSVEIPSIVQTADGLVGFCTITGQQFRDFLVMIGQFDLVDDAELASFSGRQARRVEFLQMVNDWASVRTTDEVIDIASAMRIPVAPIGSPATVADIDHFRERGAFRTNPHGFVQPRPPYASQHLDLLSVSEAPALGQCAPDDLWSERPPRADIAAGTVERPLAGVRIMDFTAFWAGPAATHVLAALGADVIKIEGLRRPDGMRFGGGKSPGVENWWEWGPVYLACNGGKRGVTLELSKPKAREVALELATRCDLVLENFSPRVMGNLGLEWADLSGANPDVVVVRMPAFGLDGPWRDRVGFAQTMEQASGMAWVTGEIDGAPLIPRGPCDPIAGLHAAFAAIAGLETRDQIGHGLQIESTMVEAALNVAAELSVEFSAYGRSVTREGNRGPEGSPQGVYRCLGDDEWIALTIRNDRDWNALVKLLSPLPDVGDTTLDEEVDRRQFADLLDDWIAKWVIDQEVGLVVEALQRAEIPCARVNSGADLLIDPQLEHRGFWEPMTHPIVGTFDAPGMPFRFRSVPGPWTTSAPPTLGEHNHEVLSTLLQMSEDDMSALESQAVIGTRPAGQ